MIGFWSKILTILEKIYKKNLFTVYRTVPRSKLNFKSANRTVKNALIFTFLMKIAPRTISRIKAFSFFLVRTNRTVIITWAVFILEAWAVITLGYGMVRYGQDLKFGLLTVKKSSILSVLFLCPREPHLVKRSYEIWVLCSSANKCDTPNATLIIFLPNQMINKF